MAGTQPIAVLRDLRNHFISRCLRDAAGDRPAHLVGGVLRDRLLGLPDRDFDAVVAGDGATIAARLAELLPARLVNLGGRDFAAYRLVGRDSVLDLWDRDPMSLQEDLARRDFTVNSIALDLADGRLVDPFGGLEDLERRVLRLTRADSLVEDPLRILRLARLTGQLPGFRAGDRTVEEARERRSLLETVASERIREELRLLVEDGHVERSLPLLRELELYPPLWIGGAGTIEGRRVTTHLERLEERARELSRLAPPERSLIDLGLARWVVLFAHLPGGDEGLAAAVRDFSDRGYLSRRRSREVIHVGTTAELPGDDSGRREYLYRMGPLWATAAVWLGVRDRTREWLPRVTELAALVASEGDRLFQPPTLLDGHDIREILGLDPGPEVGRVLSILRQAQVTGRIRTRDEAEEELRRLTNDS